MARDEPGATAAQRFSVREPDGSSAYPPTTHDPAAVRDAVLATPGVVQMHPGPRGTAATFSRSGRIWGVRLDSERLDVHLVGESGRDLSDLGRRVQQAVHGCIDDYAGRIVVHIEDISTAQPTAQPHQIASSAAVLEATEEPRRTP